MTDRIPNLVRLTNICGFDERKNDTVYCRPYKDGESAKVAVYFGGDVQDFTENMSSHRDNKNYIKWNLENIALLLQSKFVDSHILVVRPSRMEYKTFSCYQNFVPSNKCGVPEHIPTHNGLVHLEKLLANVSKYLRSVTNEELNIIEETSKLAIVRETDSNCCEEVLSTQLRENSLLRSNIHLENCDVTLIGFSKGCVVLNQFLYEFHYYNTLGNGLEFISRIKDMYWLDGGHNGGKNTWITARPLLEQLSALGIQIHVHISPYQIEDDRRPWIKKEEKLFSETLRKLNTAINRKIHFQNETPNLTIHFDILNVFKDTII